MKMILCPECDGECYLDEDTVCPECDGEGTIEEEEESVYDASGKNGWCSEYWA